MSIKMMYGNWSMEIFQYQWFINCLRKCLHSREGLVHGEGRCHLTSDEDGDDAQHEAAPQQCKFRHSTTAVVGGGGEESE